MKTCSAFDKKTSHLSTKLQTKEFKITLKLEDH